MTFEEQFLGRIASAFGLTIEQMTTPDDTSRAEAGSRYEAWERCMAAHEAELRARWHSATANAVFSLCIQPDRIQRLLTSTDRRQRKRGERLVRQREMMRPHFNPGRIPLMFPGDEIIFLRDKPTYRIET